ncbi:hypothetical protein D3C73_683080 [compost metagenome]
MAELIIVLFEIIDIDHCQGEGGAADLGAAHLLFQRQLKITMVEQPRSRVAVGAFLNITVHAEQPLEGIGNENAEAQEQSQAHHVIMVQQNRQDQRQHQRTGIGEDGVSKHSFEGIVQIFVENNVIIEADQQCVENKIYSHSAYISFQAAAEQRSLHTPQRGEGRRSRSNHDAIDGKIIDVLPPHRTAPFQEQQHQGAKQQYHKGKGEAKNKNAG